MNDDRKLVSVTPLTVRWADVDAMQHVNNAKYFTYFEQARVTWLASMDTDNAMKGQGPIVVQTTCKYLQPIVHPAALEVLMFLGTPGRSSFPTFYEIYSAGERKVKYAEGEATMVWVDLGTWKPRQVPDQIRALLRPA